MDFYRSIIIFIRSFLRNQFPLVTVVMFFPKSLEISCRVATFPANRVTRYYPSSRTCLFEMEPGYHQ